MFGSRLSGGNGPIRFKAAEVVDSERIDELESMANALDPPCIALFCVDGPVIEGISPELSGCGEIVGRHSRHMGRCSLVVESKEFGVCPHVGGVVRGKNRNVADDLQPVRMCVFPERPPLRKEQELRELYALDTICVFLCKPYEGLGLSEPEC